MSEDVSATMRVGITVILVAALVATVLNLMVMSNSILSGGQTTLQSGIDSVSTQEFAPYDNTKVSGTQVATALSLFQGRDVAVCVETKSFCEMHGKTSAPGKSGSIYMNYGALLCRNAKDGQVPYIVHGTDSAGTALAGAASFEVASAKSYFTEATTGATVQGKNSGLLYCGKVGSSASTGDIYQNPGDPYYLGLLWNQNGMVQTSYNIVGTTTVGNPQYLLSSARFGSTLIKDSTGSIIGIYFYQLN